MHEEILNQQKVAAMLGRSTKTIWRWYAKEKCFPAPIKIAGRCVGWKRSTIESFLANQ